jgi:hypothetical protein
MKRIPSFLSTLVWTDVRNCRTEIPCIMRSVKAKPKFRPNVESLEIKVVPAALTLAGGAQMVLNGAITGTGSFGANLALGYALDAIGIERDPQLAAIQRSINDLTRQVNALSTQVTVIQAELRQTNVNVLVTSLPIAQLNQAWTAYTAVVNQPASNKIQRNAQLATVQRLTGAFINAGGVFSLTNAMDGMGGTTPLMTAFSNAFMLDTSIVPNGNLLTHTFSTSMLTIKKYYESLLLKGLLLTVENLNFGGNGKPNPIAASIATTVLASANAQPVIRQVPIGTVLDIRNQAFFTLMQLPDQNIKVNNFGAQRTRVNAFNSSPLARVIKRKLGVDQLVWSPVWSAGVSTNGRTPGGIWSILNGDRTPNFLRRLGFPRNNPNVLIWSNETYNSRDALAFRPENASPHRVRQTALNATVAWAHTPYPVTDFYY